MNEDNLYSVTSLNNYIKNRLTSDPNLMALSVKGELSNFKIQASGHIYFTLKDSESAIKGVMFASFSRGLICPLKDGDEVIVSGSIGLYPPRGEYQIYARAIYPLGKGKQLIEFEQLKRKLEAEGLFAKHKRVINRYPERIGIISAFGSAALADIKTNILRRFPLVEIKVYHSLVQGSDAPKALINALKSASLDNLTTLIIGRGGGTSEDLNAFNDEVFIREVAEFNSPIISAVGHEIDFTLLDFVADLRVSTPSAAAEAATIDIQDVIEDLAMCEIRMENKLSEQISDYKKRIELIKNRSFFLNPLNIYDEYLLRLSELKARMLSGIKADIKLKALNILNFKKELDALNPDNVISRGYSLTTKLNGQIIRSIDDVNSGELIYTKLKNGIITSTITNKEK